MDLIVIDEDDMDYPSRRYARGEPYKPKVGDVFTLASWISSSDHANSDALWSIPLKSRLYCVIGICGRRSSSFIAVHEHAAPDGSRLRIHTRFCLARKTHKWVPVNEERRIMPRDSWVCWQH